jgi:hypothetical protein
MLHKWGFFCLFVFLSLLFLFFSPIDSMEIYIVLMMHLVHYCFDIIFICSLISFNVSISFICN